VGSPLSWSKRLFKEELSKNWREKSVQTEQEENVKAWKSVVSRADYSKL